MANASISRFFITLGMCVLFTLPVSACQDVQNDILAVAVAPETHGAVLLASELSSVPHLLSEQGLAQEGSADSEAWWESWSLSEGEGARLRSRIYPSAARRLFPVLGQQGVEGVLEKNEESLRAVESVRALILSDPVHDALQRARELHQEAWGALEAGDGEGALEKALHSVDALWEVSPAQVAQGLVDRATASFRRIQGSDSYSLEELTRIRRLTIGANEALEAGDYPRAIRRAYYACQLLGADPL